ncbi:MAG: hypothetical protein IJZ30_03520 [Alphaproteobacteria bacterium]|nr:hypothetical protein [Alphaproteobacteria bacterium]
MTAKMFKSALVALVGVLVATGFTSCAEERYYAAPMINTPNDTTIVVAGEITMEASFYTETKTKSELTNAYYNIDQTSFYELINTFENETTFSDSKEQSARVNLVLSKDTIFVDELFQPELISSTTTPLDSTSNISKRTFSFEGVDTLSDGQSSKLTANYVANLVIVNGDSVKLPHVKIDSVKLSNITTEKVEERVNKVTMHYEVHFIEDTISKMGKVYPFYYQVVKVSEPEPEPEPELDQVGNPYLIADTTLVFSEKNVRCKVNIYEVTPHTLAPNDTVLKDKKTFEVLSVGTPGTESLYVKSTVPKVTYSHKDETPKSGTNGNFSYATDVTSHTWKAVFDNNDVIRHEDIIYLRVTDITWSSELTTFKWDNSASIEAVYDKVVSLPEKEGEEGYLGTRVLKVKVSLNGIEVNTFTGYTHLYQQK